METYILIVIGLAVAGIIIWQLVRSSRAGKSGCGCCSSRNSCSKDYGKNVTCKKPDS
jgi:hypothetical protein